MDTHTILVYDGNFDGFLSCVFAIYEYKITSFNICKASENNEELFATTEIILTNQDHAKRVWKGLSTKIPLAQQKTIFNTFLSEIKGVENTLFYYIQYIFKNKRLNHIDYSNKDILKISQVAKMVKREKHRLEAFVRFKQTKDAIYVATVTPDFNVLPLIINHFKDRYADQKWIIYDIKRSYGIYYNLIDVEMITVENSSVLNTTMDPEYFKDNELEFQQLWRTYFNNVNIVSRKNMKLHTQHIPKRYWKYLTEKN